MCKFCKTEPGDITNIVGEHADVKVGNEVRSTEKFKVDMYVNDNDVPEYFISADYSVDDHFKYSVEIPIKFCPFCGRELHNTRSLI